MKCSRGTTFENHRTHMLDRIRDTNLGPEQFARTFSALLQGINLTNSPGLAITIDYGDGPVGPDSTYSRYHPFLPRQQ